MVRSPGDAPPELGTVLLDLVVRSPRDGAGDGVGGGGGGGGGMDTYLVLLSISIWEFGHSPSGVPLGNLHLASSSQFPICPLGNGWGGGGGGFIFSSLSIYILSVPRLSGGGGGGGGVPNLVNKMFQIVNFNS